MKKVRASLPKKKWAGLVTKYPAASSYISPDEFSEGTTNLDTSVHGVISKRSGGVTFGSGATSLTDQFEAVFVDGTRYSLHMDNGSLKYTTGDSTLTLIKSGYTAAASMEFSMHADRVYFCNGVSAAQVLDRTASYGGAFALPVTLTVAAFAGLAGDTVTIGTTTKTEGVNWTAATSNNATATSLATALSAIAGVTATAVANVITVTSQTPSIVRLSDAVNLTIASVAAPRIKDAGAQAPTSTLTAAVGAGGLVPVGTYTYKVTFLYYDTSESNGGTVSGAVSPGVPSQITLTNIPIGGYGVTSRLIYRDDGTSGYRFVAEIANNTATTGTDNAAVGLEFIPVDNGVLPQFKYITHHLDRFFMCGVAGRTSDVFFTEAGQADIVRSTNFVPANAQDSTSGIDVYQDKPIVLNRSSFGQIYGDTSDTFRYVATPGTIGCVDNRSIRVRTLIGLPTIMWLSDKGFYEYNGSTVNYISDPIETLVNFNLQQADFTSGSNTDSAQADFAAGTSSAGILLSAPSGSVTVPNPKATYDTQTAWEAASAFTNLITKQTATQDPSKIGTPLGHTFNFTTEQELGTEGVVIAPTQLTLTPATDSTGETHTSNGSLTPGLGTSSVQYASVAVPITVTRGGTLTGFSLTARVFTSTVPVTPTYTFQLLADAFGTPGAVLQTSNKAITMPVPDGGLGTGGATATLTSSAVAWALTGGVRYWLAIVYNFTTSFQGAFLNFPRSATSWSGGLNIYTKNSTNTSAYAATPTATATQGSFTFTQAAVAATGTWVSETFDAGFLNDATLRTVYADNTSATYPAGTSSTTYIDASNDDTFASFDTATLSSLNGSSSTTIARREFYRLRVKLDTTDDRNVPVYNALSFGFGTTATWVSATIDHTTDITVLNSVTIIASLPAGTSATVKIRKSTDDITYAELDTFTVSDGTHTIDISGVTNPLNRYTQIKFTLVSDANIATKVAQISSAVVKWTTVSTFTSADIDIGSTPSGWDIFTTDTTENGGTVVYTMRSSAGGGSGSYISVTSGQYPTGVSPLRHSQWKAVITATADKVPIIASVTVGWFIGTAASSIRAASLFYNRTYYIAVAESEQTTNNIVLSYDQNGKWYRHDGMSIATMGMFFSRPLVALAATPTLVRWLSGLTDQGTNIGLDFRTKALDFDDATKTKMLRSITVTVENTGATWTFTYSVDQGATFLPLVDYTGSASFTTSTAGTLALRKLVPQWPNQISGKDIMIRGVSSDSHDAKFYELAIDAFIRESEITHG